MIKNLKINKVSDSKTTFKCLNDIHDVISGKRPADESKLWFDATQYAYGLGNGSVTTIEALGEAILVNGTAYTKSADQHAANYYHMGMAKKFMTSWMFLVPKEATPAYEVMDNGADINASVGDIYAAIYEKMNAEFVVVGVMYFDVLNASAIAKAPIDDQNIFDHQDIYYPHRLDLKEVSTVIVGVAADMQKIENQQLKSSMEKVVYYNPLEGEAEKLTTHEHVLILKNHPRAIEEVSEAEACDVEHLFTYSIVKRCHLKIYAIEAII